MEFEILVEKFIVTEWKDGCIYKTKSLGETWVALNTPMYTPDDKGIMYAAISTKRLLELNHKTIRRKGG